MFNKFDTGRFKSAEESFMSFLKICITLFSGLVVAILSLIAFIGEAGQTNQLVESLLRAVPIFVRGASFSLLMLGVIIAFKFGSAFNFDKAGQVILCALMLFMLSVAIFYIGLSHGTIEQIWSVLNIKNNDL